MENQSQIPESTMNMVKELLRPYGGIVGIVKNDSRDELPQLIRLSHAARRLDCTPTYLYQLIKAGKIKIHRPGGLAGPSYLEVGDLRKYFLCGPNDGGGERRTGAGKRKTKTDSSSPNLVTPGGRQA